MSRHHSPVWVLLGLTVFALAFRLVLAVGFPNDEPDDGRIYAQIAQNVLQQGVYSLESAAPYLPTYIRVPGYPLFLASIYAVCGINNNTAVRIIQAVIDTAACWLVVALALALLPASWGGDARRRTTLAALALATACPFTAVYVATIMTETLAVALSTAIAWCSVEGLARRTSLSVDVPSAPPRRAAWAWWLGAGAAGGALTMIRPEGGLLVAGAGTALCVSVIRRDRSPGAGRRHSWLKTLLWSAGAFSLGVAVFMAPWTYRNYATFGVFQPLAPAVGDMPGPGYTGWLGTWVDEPKYVEPFEFDIGRERLKIEKMPDRAFDSPEERARVASLFARYNGQGVAAPAADGAAGPPPSGMTPELDDEFGRLAQERITRHPFRHYVTLPAKRAASLWLDTHSQYYPFEGELFPLSALNEEVSQGFWLPLFAFLVAVYSILAVAGGAILLPTPAARSSLWVLLVLTFPRLVLLASLEHPEPRYTVEFFPVVAALGAVALGALPGWRRASGHAAERPSV